MNQLKGGALGLQAQIFCTGMTERQIFFEYY